METKRIKYKITFLSDWHAGSGLSSGANADAVVIKDKYNLPYLPGKTVKGLLKDVFNDFSDLDSNFISIDFVDHYFGSFNEEENCSNKGVLFFSNAELHKKEKNEISEEMSHFLYRNISSTKIESNGVTAPGSLHAIEVTIPVTLHGYIDGVIRDKDIVLFEKAFNYLRHIGANRNRGLGRCKMELKHC